MPQDSGAVKILMARSCVDSLKAKKFAIWNFAMALIELIYTSFSEADTQERDVRDILASSETNNVATSITGLLLFDGERYIQILEGDIKDVESLYEVICQDDRHHALELLHKGGIANRSFSNWRMAYESMPKGLLAHLAESMGVFSLELEDAPLSSGESFGAKLNGMFMDAIAAE